jgi:hypothetical protein
MVWKSFPVVVPRFGYFLHFDAHSLKILRFPSRSEELNDEYHFVVQILPQRPCKAAYELDLNSWIFKEASRAFFRDIPAKPKRNSVAEFR